MNNSISELVLNLDSQFDHLYAIQNKQEIIALSQLSQIPQTQDYEFSLSVSKKFRGKGLGKTLVKKTIQEARSSKLNANALRSHCLRSNSPIMELLKSSGFLL